MVLCVDIEAPPGYGQLFLRLSTMNLGVVFFDERRDSFICWIRSMAGSDLRPRGCSSLAGLSLVSAFKVCLGMSRLRPWDRSRGS